jgi:hypothetical protein
MEHPEDERRRILEEWAAAGYQWGRCLRCHDLLTGTNGLLDMHSVKDDLCTACWWRTLPWWDRTGQHMQWGWEDGYGFWGWLFVLHMLVLRKPRRAWQSRCWWRVRHADQ